MDNTTNSVANNASEARRLMIQNDFDVIIIIAPLKDEFGTELAQYITSNSQSGVILIGKQEIADQISAQVEDYGVLVVGMPIGKATFYQALKMASVMKRRMEQLRAENAKLQNKLKDVNKISRAKCLLIQYMNLTEEEAHRQIEKQAMDKQSTRKEIAEMIIENYAT